MLRSGDKVRARPGSVAAIWADGRTGTVQEVRDPASYSWNDSRNLVLWDGDTIDFGFRHEDLIKEEENEQ